MSSSAGTRVDLTGPGGRIEQTGNAERWREKQMKFMAWQSGKDQVPAHEPTKFVREASELGVMQLR